MVREDGRKHAAMSRILQPEDGAKNRLTLHGKRLGQNFHDVTIGREGGPCALACPSGRLNCLRLLLPVAMTCRASIQTDTSRRPSPMVPIIVPSDVTSILSARS